MKTNPQIGITSSQPREEDGALHHELVPYVRAIVRAGGEPVLLVNDEANVDELLASLDGLLLTGGVDVDPSRYGGKPDHPHAATGKYRAERDGFEIALVRAARARRLPALCICRGLQIASVAFGGTLIEDVRDELGERYTINHRQTYENGQDRAEYAPGHDVRLEAGSKLARLLGATAFTTNSMHHQAIRSLGEELEVVGRTSDGVIEAFEAAADDAFFFGVQWHPEELIADPFSERLFGALTASALEGRSETR